MARARNIKPSIMANDELASLPPLTRLLFIYLWMLADRDGRLEDKPKRIGAQALPYDSVDADSMLSELHANGFINRYVAKGVACIQIISFSKHQNPHSREQPSELPALDNGTSPEIATNDLGSDKEQPEPEQAGLIPSSLIPDSGFLIPDSSPSLRSGENNLKEANASLSSGEPDDVEDEADSNDGSALPASLPSCPHRRILALWAEILPELPQHEPELWDGAREAALRQRWRRTAALKNWTSQEDGIRHFRDLFAYIRYSAFLTGGVDGRDGKAPFQATLEWVTRARNWAKVSEGTYHSAEEYAAWRAEIKARRAQAE